MILRRLIDHDGFNQRSRSSTDTKLVRKRIQKRATGKHPSFVLFWIMILYWQTVPGPRAEARGLGRGGSPGRISTERRTAEELVDSGLARLG